MHLTSDQRQRLLQALETDRLRTCTGLTERIGAHMLDPDVDKRQRERMRERFRSERPTILQTLKHANAHGRLISLLGDAPIKRKKISDEKIVETVDQLLDQDYIDSTKIETVLHSVLARQD